MTQDERIARLEKAVFGDPTERDDNGIVPRVVSLERDRNIMRLGLGTLFGLGAAAVQQWLAKK